VAKLGHIFSAVPLLKEMCLGNNNDWLPNRWKRSAHGVKSDHIDGAAVIIT
jgi:hypothetical protein